MVKMSFKEIQNIVSECGVELNPKKLYGKKFCGVYHYHEWDHGYESDIGYNGSRREFYSDMREMLNFLLDYIKLNNISELIVAPFFSTCQFSSMTAYPDKTKSIYLEIYNFLKKCNIRKDSRCGVKIDIEKTPEVIEMILEGAFLDDVSNLRIFFPSQSVVLDLTHHFDIAFFTPNFEKESLTIKNLLKHHDTLRYYEQTYQ